MTLHWAIPNKDMIQLMLSKKKDEMNRHYSPEAHWFDKKRIMQNYYYIMQSMHSLELSIFNIKHHQSKKSKMSLLEIIKTVQYEFRKKNSLIGERRKSIN
jgi:hypothetical protein